jgi:hypothetical protein
MRVYCLVDSHTRCAAPPGGQGSAKRVAERAVSTRSSPARRRGSPTFSLVRPRQARFHAHSVCSASRSVPNGPAEITISQHPSLSLPRARAVRRAPPLSSPLCCRRRRALSTVAPMYVAARGPPLHTRPYTYHGLLLRGSLLLGGSGMEVTGFVLLRALASKAPQLCYSPCRRMARVLAHVHVCQHALYGAPGHVGVPVRL